MTSPQANHTIVTGTILRKRPQRIRRNWICIRLAIFIFQRFHFSSSTSTSLLICKISQKQLPIRKKQPHNSPNTFFFFHSISILISYGLAGSSAYTSFFNHLDLAVEHNDLIAPFIILLTLIVIFASRFLQPIVSFLTLGKGGILFLMVNECNANMFF